MRIDTVMTDLGWKRTFDRYADYTLRWTENTIQINYGTFKEGEQIVNHIPNCGLLTNKLGLLLSLRDYERRYQNRYGRLPIMVMDDFFPTTFIVDDPKEREAYLKIHQSDVSSLWICKPIGQNQGKGIFLVRDIEAFKVQLQKRDEEARNQPSGLPPRIIQRYIINPLLLDGCKFDIRCYILIACTMPYLVFYHPGYIRRSAKPYSSDDPNLVTHLTNQFVQKKDPGYSEIKNNTVWSWTQVNDYINQHYQEEKKLPVDWAKTILQWKIQRIIHHIFTTVKNRLAARVGLFELLGLDFMLDENMKVWLLEVNSNPALQTHCDVLKEVVPVVVKDALHISIECFEKSRHQKCLLPLHGLEDSSAFIFCQRSNRYARFSWDDTPVINKTNGDLGLPRGWNLLYSESQAAFRARWPTVQSCSLRSWIPPRYKPALNQVNFEMNEQNKESHTLSQTMKSTGVTDENLKNATTVLNENEVNYTSNERNSLQNSNTRQLFYPRTSLPEYRTFEYSLRRYPVIPNSMKNVRLPRRRIIASQSFKSSNENTNVQDVLKTLAETESLITVGKPNNHIITFDDNNNSSNSTRTNNNRQILTYQSRRKERSLSNTNSLNSKHESDVLSEDEILTGKSIKKTKLKILSIHREPIHMGTVHLVTKADIDKAFNDTNSNNKSSDISNNNTEVAPLSINTKRGSQLTRTNHSSAGGAYSCNNIQSKFTDKRHNNSKKLNFIESRSSLPYVYGNKGLEKNIRSRIIHQKTEEVNRLTIIEYK
uniref:Protein polyglycylase TTLL10 n=3 Tax=Trichobilharzia regenti TaxID=157069 RepID=A0AA85K0C4_TRIRE|nr:unnamed protein product [Trichobilharzia regenti]